MHTQVFKKSSAFRVSVLRCQSTAQDANLIVRIAQTKSSSLESHSTLLVSASGLCSYRRLASSLGVGQSIWSPLAPSRCSVCQCPLPITLLCLQSFAFSLVSWAPLSVSYCLNF